MARQTEERSGRRGGGRQRERRRRSDEDASDGREGRGDDDSEERERSAGSGDDSEPRGDSDEQGTGPRDEDGDDDRSRERPRRPHGGARAVAERAKRELSELMGRQAESVSSLDRDEDGWHVTLEFLELARIPNTSDLLATYEAVIDDDGELVSYRRLRRYVRSQADEV